MYIEHEYHTLAASDLGHLSYITPLRPLELRTNVTYSHWWKWSFWHSAMNQVMPGILTLTQDHSLIPTEATIMIHEMARQRLDQHEDERIFSHNTCGRLSFCAVSCSSLSSCSCFTPLSISSIERFSYFARFRVADSALGAGLFLVATSGNTRTRDNSARTKSHYSSNFKKTDTLISNRYGFRQLSRQEFIRSTSCVHE